MSTQPQSHYYDSAHYDSKRRFISYWHQIDETLSLKPSTVLEVGKGNGFVESYLQKLGITVTTIDVDPSLNPDTVGGITKTPFQNKQFDVVMACEILEHIPYSESVQALKEIARISSFAVISIPDNTPWYKIEANLPLLGRIRYFYNKKRTIARDFTNDTRGHFWEIGTNEHSNALIESEMKKYFILKKSYRIPEHPSHHFFVLQSRAAQ